jgi:hypothetical protein
MPLVCVVPSNIGCNIGTEQSRRLCLEELVYLGNCFMFCIRPSSNVNRTNGCCAAIEGWRENTYSITALSLAPGGEIRQSTVIMNLHLIYEIKSKVTMMRLILARYYCCLAIHGQWHDCWLRFARYSVHYFSRHFRRMQFPARLEKRHKAIFAGSTPTSDDTHHTAAPIRNQHTSLPPLLSIVLYHFS